MSQNWIFVINNPEPEEVEELMVNAENWAWDEADHMFAYLCVGLEVGESGTMHLQGYCQFKKRIGLKKTQRLINPERPEGVHVEMRKGSHAQAREYIANDEKEGSLGWVEWGEPFTEGARMDLNQIGHWLKQGKTTGDIYRLMRDEHWGAWSRVYRSIEAGWQKQQEETIQEWTDIQVIVFWGPTGTGKSKRARAMTRLQNCYPLMTDTNPIWFDRYANQPDLLIEEFRTKNMSLEMFLTILDGYPRLLPVKGGTVWKNWTRVIVTSNKPPHRWYGQDVYAEHGDACVLKRRISKIYKVEGLAPDQVREVQWGDE